MSSKGRDKKDAKSNDGGSENVTDKEFVQREIAIGLLREKASRYDLTVHHTDFPANVGRKRVRPECGPAQHGVFV